MKNNIKRFQDDLHHEICDVLLTKKELKYQLWNNWCQNNILKLLSVKNISNEESQCLLLMVGIKFEQISGYFYAGKDENGNKIKKKLSKKDYEYILFDAFIDSAEECAERLNTLDSVFAKTIFDRYIAIKRYIVQMVACVDEQYYACEFMEIVSYVLKNGFDVQSTLNSFQEILKEKQFDLCESNYKL